MRDHEIVPDRSARRSTTPPARRSTRPPACSASATRAGPAIQREAEAGDPESFSLPIAMSHGGGLDFSFSGLKTALVYAVDDLGPDRGRGAPRRPRRELPERPSSASSSPSSAGRSTRGGLARRVALGGGVAANALLRERAAALCEERGVRLKLVAAASSAPTTPR